MEEYGHRIFEQQKSSKGEERRMAAGAINTPKLLLLSGIELERINVAWDRGGPYETNIGRIFKTILV